MKAPIVIAGSSAVFALIGVIATIAEGAQSAFGGGLIFAFVGLGIGAFASRQGEPTAE